MVLRCRALEAAGASMVEHEAPAAGPAPAEADEKGTAILSTVSEIVLITCWAAAQFPLPCAMRPSP